MPTGYRIDFGTPDIYGLVKGSPWCVLGRQQYWHYYDRSHNPEFERAPFDWSAGFHDLVGNWRGDGSNLLDLIVDRKLVSHLYEYHQNYLDPADGKRKQLAMHLIISNQAIPGFSRGTANVADNDGTPDGWTIVVQEISGWYGNVQDPDSLRASPENGLGTGQ